MIFWNVYLQNNNNLAKNTYHNLKEFEIEYFNPFQFNVSFLMHSSGLAENWPQMA